MRDADSRVEWLSVVESMIVVYVLWRDISQHLARWLAVVKVYTNTAYDMRWDVFRAADIRRDAPVCVIA